MTSLVLLFDSLVSIRTGALYSVRLCGRRADAAIQKGHVGRFRCQAPDPFRWGMKRGRSIAHQQTPQSTHFTHCRSLSDNLGTWFGDLLSGIVDSRTGMTSAHPHQTTYCRTLSDRIGTCLTRNACDYRREFNLILPSLPMSGFVGHRGRTVWRKKPPHEPVPIESFLRCAEFVGQSGRIHCAEHPFRKSGNFLRTFCPHSPRILMKGQQRSFRRLNPPLPGFCPSSFRDDVKCSFTGFVVCFTPRP